MTTFASFLEQRRKQQESDYQKAAEIGETTDQPALSPSPPITPSEGGFSEFLAQRQAERVAVEAPPAVGMGDLRLLEAASPPAAFDPAAVAPPTVPVAPTSPIPAQSIGSFNTAAPRGQAAAQAAQAAQMALSAPGMGDGPATIADKLRGASDVATARHPLAKVAAIAALTGKMSVPEKAFAAGVGDVTAAAGSAARFAGQEELGQQLSGVGQMVQQVYGSGLPEVPFEGPKSLVDPAYLQTAGPRALAFPVAMGPLAIAGGAAGANVAGAVGLGKIGTTIAASIGGALASRPLESAMEAGGVYEEALGRGLSEEEAQKAARRTFWQNNALVVMDAGELFTALAPLPGPLKTILGAADVQTLSRVKRAVAGVSKVAATGVQEAAEEGVQDVIQRKALGDPVAFDLQMQEAMGLGALMGGGMGVAGAGVNIQGRAQPAPPPSPTTEAPVTPAPPAPPQPQPSIVDQGLDLARQIVPQQAAPAQATSAPQAAQPATIDRAQLLRDANPGMDERAIVDMVRTTQNLGDEEFKAFAQRVGTPTPAPSPSPVAPANEYAGQTFKHFTTPAAKAALESGAVFDYNVNPQHGTGDLGLGPKTGRFAGNRLYLSLDDSRWGTVRREAGKGQIVEAAAENEGQGEPFYDYERQKWMRQIGGTEDVALEPVSYTLDSAAKVLTVKSDADLKQALREASESSGQRMHWDSNAFWDALATRYDAVAIRNVKETIAQTDSKFFKSAGGDQLIVLNPAAARVAQASQGPDAGRGVSTPSPTTQTPVPGYQGASGAASEGVTFEEQVRRRVQRARDQERDVRLGQSPDKDAPARPKKMGINTAVDHVARYFPELGWTKKRIKEELQKPSAIETAGRGSFAVYGANNVPGFDDMSKTAIGYDLYALDTVDEWAARKVVELQAQTPKTTEATLPPISAPETIRPMTMTELERQVRLKLKSDTAVDNFLKDPNGWRILQAKPTDPMGRFWVAKKAEEAGKPFPQKVADLLMAQASLIAQAKTKANKDALAQNTRDLEQAIKTALAPGTPTSVERILAGDQPVSLTGQALPPGALEGRTQTSSGQQTPAAPTTQQADIFSDLETSPAQRLAQYHAELAQVRTDRAAAKRRHEGKVQELAVGLAKDATKENQRVRKEMWDAIKDRGYIGAPKTKRDREDFYGQLSPKLNHLKRKDGVPLDILATDMGYANEGEFIRAVNAVAEIGPVTADQAYSEAAYYVDSSPEGEALKAELDYYRDAEQAVLEAIAEAEGAIREQGRAGASEAQAGLQADAAGESRGEGAAVPGVGQATGQGGTGAGRDAGGPQAQAAVEPDATDSAQAIDDVQAMAAPARILGSTPPAASKGTVKRLDIVRHFSEGLRIPIRQGRFLQKALGIFKVRQEAIRTKLAEDLRTITHEVGHYLDKRFNLADAAFDAELLPLGATTSLPSYTLDQVRAEGVAEFTNLYLTDRAAVGQAAPLFLARFEQALKTEPKVQKVITTGQDMLHTYVAQNATDMVKSGISYEPKGTKITWESVRQKVWDLYEAWWDKHDPIRQAELKLNKNQRLPAGLSPKAQADIGRGWEGLAKTFLERGVVDANGKKVGPSLREILEPIGDRLDDFSAYAASMRALYLHKTRGWDDTKLPFPLWAARQTVREYRSVEFTRAFKQLQVFQDAVLQYYADAGFLSPDQLRQIRAANQVYVPYLREMAEEGPGMRQVLGPKYANVGNAVIKMKGGTGTVINPLHSIIHNTFKLINLAQRNQVAVKLANLADTAEGGGAVIEDVTKSFRPATFQLDQIKDVLNAEMAHTGLDVDDLGMDMSAVATVFTPNLMPNGGDAQKGIFAVYRNGKTSFYQADPELYRALNALDKPALNWFFTAMSYVTKPKRAFAVITPEFIARNFGRDTLTAGVYGRGLPLEGHIRGFLAQIFDPEAVTRWMAGGGYHSSIVSADRDYQAETVRHLVGGRLRTIKENLLPPWRALQNLSEFIERAPRIGEMLMAEQGSALERKIGLGPDPVDTPTAILESRDVSLDFGRSGNLGQQYNQITAFFNAAMQDLDKFFRMHTNPKTAGRTIARGFAFITMPTLLLWLANKDDEEYKEFPQWRKDLFWNFKLGGRWWMWPAPHTLALVYKAIPERIFNAIYQENPEALTKNLGETTGTLAGPNLVPDALALAVELKFDWKLFGDRPMIPRGEQAKEAAQQAGPYTSESGKRLGAAINVAPRKVDHAVQGVLAGGGRYLLSATDAALRAIDKATGQPEPPPRSTRDPAIVRAFSPASPLASGAQSIDDFYDLKERHDKLWASLPGRANVDKPLGDYDKWTAAERKALAEVVQNLSAKEQEMIGDNFQRWRLKTRPDLNKVATQLSSYSKAKQAVEKAANLSPDAKRMELERIERLRLNAARKALGKPEL